MLIPREQTTVANALHTLKMWVIKDRLRTLAELGSDSAGSGNLMLFGRIEGLDAVEREINKLHDRLCPPSPPHIGLRELRAAGCNHPFEARTEAESISFPYGWWTDSKQHLHCVTCHDEAMITYMEEVPWQVPQ